MSTLNRLKTSLGAVFRAKAPTLQDGIYVSALGSLRLQGDSADLALSTGASHTVSMSSESNGITVTITSTPFHAGEKLSSVRQFPLVQLSSVRQFPLVQASLAQELFASTVASWHRTLQGQEQPSAHRRGGSFVLGAITGAALLTVVGLMLNSGAASPTTQAALQGPAAAPMAPAPSLGGAPAASADLAAQAQEAMRRLSQAKLGPEELARVTSAHRIEMRKGTAPLAAFSDPNCPACRDLERESAAMKVGSGFAVIPVGFQPGSRVVVAKVLCSKNPAQAWAEAIKGINPQNEACQEGLRKVDENNKLFVDIGASATPTLVAANGQLAQGAAQATQLDIFASTYAQ